MAEMNFHPLDKPIAHNGSPECPVHPETRVMIIIDETADMTPEMFAAALAIKDMRAPADRIAELEAENAQLKVENMSARDSATHHKRSAEAQRNRCKTLRTRKAALIAGLNEVMSCTSIEDAKFKASVCLGGWSDDEIIYRDRTRRATLKGKTDV